MKPPTSQPCNWAWGSKKFEKEKRVLDQWTPSLYSRLCNFKLTTAVPRERGYILDGFSIQHQLPAAAM